MSFISFGDPNEERA